MHRLRHAEEALSLLRFLNKRGVARRDDGLALGVARRDDGLALGVAQHAAQPFHN